MGSQVSGRAMAVLALLACLLTPLNGLSTQSGSSLRGGNSPHQQEQPRVDSPTFSHADGEAIPTQDGMNKDDPVFNYFIQVDSNAEEAPEQRLPGTRDSFPAGIKDGEKTENRIPAPRPLSIPSFAFLESAQIYQKKMREFAQKVDADSGDLKAEGGDVSFVQEEAKVCKNRDCEDAYLGKGHTLAQATWSQRHNEEDGGARPTGGGGDGLSDYRMRHINLYQDMVPYSGFPNPRGHGGQQGLNWRHHGPGEWNGHGHNGEGHHLWPHEKEDGRHQYNTVEGHHGEFDWTQMLPGETATFWDPHPHNWLDYMRWYYPGYFYMFGYYGLYGGGGMWGSAGAAYLAYGVYGYSGVYGYYGLYGYYGENGYYGIYGHRMMWGIYWYAYSSYGIWGQGGWLFWIKSGSSGYYVYAPGGGYYILNGGFGGGYYYGGGSGAFIQGGGQGGGTWYVPNIGFVHGYVVDDDRPPLGLPPPPPGPAKQ